jgi:hypothetical protein
MIGAQKSRCCVLDAILFDVQMCPTRAKNDFTINTLFLKFLSKPTHNQSGDPTRFLLISIGQNHLLV